MPYSDTLFHVNIWIVALTSIVFVALLVALINSYRTKSRLKISKIEVRRKNPLQISEWYGHRTKEQMRDHLLDFRLSLVLKNSGHTALSVEKPQLVLTIPNGKSMFGVKYKKIYLNEFNRKSNVTDQELAWKLDGLQVIPVEVLYVVENLDDLFDIVDNYQIISYSIEYSDNSGKKYTKEVSDVIEL